MNLKDAETPDEQRFQEQVDKSVERSKQFRTLVPPPRPASYTQPGALPKRFNEPLECFGFGTLRKEYPLMPMRITRREPEDDDVVIEILCCGVCHSDWHVIRDEWKNTKYPIVVGHEIVGRVLFVGSKVKTHAVKDIVAVGPNVDSCRICKSCKSGDEQYCTNDVTEAYNMYERLPGEIKPTGPVSQGGYANVIVVKDRFVLEVPKDVPVAKLPQIAPLLCAGITMYTPLTHNSLSKGSRVGIAGIGGLGHLGLRMGHVLGYETIGLTTTPAKLKECANLQADQILLATSLTTMDAYRETFDMIVCTIPFRHEVNMYIDLLKPKGIMWIVGSIFTMAVDFDRVNRRGRLIKGSSTGGVADTQACIDFCWKHKILPDVEAIKFTADDINSTHEGIINRTVKYRYVIVMNNR
jgi:uncharacterized zinc-type alcohol dehydrogenase-like protein